MALKIDLLKRIPSKRADANGGEDPDVYGLYPYEMGNRRAQLQPEVLRDMEALDGLGVINLTEDDENPMGGTDYPGRDGKALSGLRRGSAVQETGTGSRSIGEKNNGFKIRRMG